MVRCREDFHLPLAAFVEMMENPEPYTPGTINFWDDDHISRMALEAHLDPNTDAASRNPVFMNASVQFISAAALGLDRKKVLDLGCGPGLYAQRLTSQGAIVTGLDISRNSIAYAKKEAQRLGLDIDYRRMDFFDMQFEAEFDLAMQIYGEICVFSAADRGRLLDKVHAALRPGGLFIFDVTTPLFEEQLSGRSWQALESGFWKPYPHLVLEYGIEYEEGMLHLDQYAIFDENGKMDLCRIWTQHFDPQGIIDLLAEHGFEVLSLHGDLTGAPLAETGWIGIVARKTA
ncbi:MAG: class I SAM-dependent methyltransferase [Methanomassiliicoccales archaeon]